MIQKKLIPGRDKGMTAQRELCTRLVPFYEDDMLPFLLGSFNFLFECSPHLRCGLADSAEMLARQSNGGVDPLYSLVMHLLT
jgi:hypothetical protein